MIKEIVFLIYRCHSNLIVSQKCFHEGQVFLAGYCMHQLVNVGKWVAILQAGLVEVYGVYVHSPHSIVLFYQHYIRQQFGVVNFFHETYVGQLLCFFGYNSLTFQSKTSFLLLYGMMIQVYIQVVHRYLGPIPSISVGVQAKMLAFFF